MDIMVWLRSLGIGKYEAAFRENEIDETVLPGLRHEGLEGAARGVEVVNTSQYAFADRAQEHRRLATQAELLDPLTERVFREAGLGTGMRVLDLGSGAGDVAILVSAACRA
jgi:hypothetical protein